MEVMESTKSKTWAVRLSAIWMDDHLDVWNEKDFGPSPEGEFKGNSWKGIINERQGKEIIDRASIYWNPKDFSEEAARYCFAARRVINALYKQAPDLFK